MILNTNNVNEYIFNPLGEMNNKDTYFDFINFCSDYKVFGQDIKVGTDEFMQHLHIKLNESCNAKCKFCIEKHCHRKIVTVDKFMENLKVCLDELQRVGLLNSVSITGGEPTLEKEKYLKLLKLLSNYKINRLTMNTNGAFLLDEETLEATNKAGFHHVNISRHHHNDKENNNIMRMKNNCSNKHLEKVLSKLNKSIRVRLQCVLTRETIQDTLDIREFVSWAKSVGIDNVSFRQLIGCSETYGRDIYDFTNSNIVSITDIIKDIYRDNDFDFVYQTIMDYYIYECWNYKGVDIDLSYADMSLLENIEKEEMDNNIFREFIFNTDGSFGGSWFGGRKVLYK